MVMWHLRIEMMLEMIQVLERHDRENPSTKKPGTRQLCLPFGIVRDEACLASNSAATCSFPPPRGYSEALGGRLSLVAEFPNQEPVILSGIAALNADGGAGSP